MSDDKRVFTPDDFAEFHYTSERKTLAILTHKEKAEARIKELEGALEIAAIDNMSIIEWAESHYPGLTKLPEWQGLKRGHRHCVETARAALGKEKA